MTDRKPASSGSGKRYDAILDQCRQRFVVFSDERLAQMMENASGALLDFAERAESDAVQGRFFEAISELNRRRDELIQVYRREINRGFEGMAMGTPIAAENEGQDQLEGGELTLLDPEEMEESVASENLILRANASYFPELYALSQRLGVVIGGRKLKDHQIPGGPHHLVSAFRRSIQGVDLETRIKVVLYALFDKFLLKQVKPVYDDYNDLLAKGGVLPTLKPVSVRSDNDKGKDRDKEEEEPEEEVQDSDVDDFPEAPPTGYDAEQPGGPQGAGATANSTYNGMSAGASNGAGPGPGPSLPLSSDLNSVDATSSDQHRLGNELFDSIIDLMSTRGTRAGGGHGVGAQLGASAESEPQTRVLLSAISSIQANRPPDAVSTAVTEATRLPNVEIDTGFIARVKQALNVERQQVVDAVGSENMPPMDSDLIDLIGMLFEYMLNDPVLPNIAKALLSHLHTPYLKVALIDRRLLVDSKHPARRLLDQMVEAGSLLVEEGNPTRGMFPTMQKIVDRVLQEFTDNVELFDELLTLFDDKMREQQRRTDTMEQRTQEAARGRERLALAKQRAAREIQALVSRYPLPKPVAGFLLKTWLDNLVFILLRDKDEDKGQNWKQTAALAEQLVALFDPNATPEHRRARMAVLPKLRVAIAAATKRAGVFNSPDVTALLALLDSPEDWQSHALEKPKVPIPQTPGLAPGATQPLPSSPGAPGEEGLSEAEREMIQRLRKMRFGTWFEFTGPPGSSPRRIKLSWMSPLTSTCMFVDRSGVQAEIKSLKELAQEVLAGRAKIVPRPKHPFIDRALVSIRKMLQTDQEPGAPSPRPARG